MSLSADHQHLAFVQSSYATAPEVHAGTLGDTPPPAVTAINAGLKPSWGKAESVEWDNEGFHDQGWLLYPAHYDPTKSLPDDRQCARRPGQCRDSALARRRLRRGAVVGAGLFRVHAEPAWQLRPGREIRAGQPQGLRLRRPARHARRRRCGREEGPRGRQAAGPHRLELWRLHEHVRADPDPALPRGGGRCRHFQLAELLRPEPDRPVDAAVLRRHGLRRSRPCTRKARRSTSSRR